MNNAGRDLTIGRMGNYYSRIRLDDLAIYDRALSADEIWRLYNEGCTPEPVQEDVAYRFGFQGQEKDDEMHGATGTSYAFEFRMHDARVGRFLSLDPLATKYPHNSPYAFSENRVVDGRDLEGAEYVHYYIFLDQGNNLVQKVAVEDFRNMSDAQVRAIHGMSRDEFLEKFSQTFGPEGRGAKYIFFRQGDDGRYDRWGSMWEQWQPKDLTADGGLSSHGFYYGAGCVTAGGPLCGSHGPTTTREQSKAANPYDYSVAPIDEVDGLARQHDIDYDFPSYVEGTWDSDPNTLPADRAFVNGLRAYLARAEDENYVDSYTGRVPSTEARRAARFAITFFENYVIPKKEGIQKEQKKEWC